MDVKQALIAILNRNQEKLKKIGAGWPESFPVTDIETQAQSMRIQNIRNTALTEFIQLAEQAKEPVTNEYLNPYWTRTHHTQTIMANPENRETT